MTAPLPAKRKAKGYRKLSPVQALYMFDRPRMAKPANDNSHQPDAPFFYEPVIATAQEGVPADEVDAGYLAAVRLKPRVVGLSAGEVPYMVAMRLWRSGWVRRG